MTTYNFGTQFDPAHYVEIPDTANPGQVKRPDAGVILKARNHSNLAALPDITTTTYGYWATTTTDVPQIQVSGDGGSTWVGPLDGAEARTAVINAGVDVTNLTTRVTSVEGRVTTLEASGGGGGGGGAVTAAGITDSTSVGRQVITAPDAATARSALGAGTSNVVIGTTAGTAKDGAYQPTTTNISDAGATGRNVLKAATTAAAKTAIALDQVDNVSDVNKPVSAATAAALAGKQKTIPQFANQAAAAAAVSAGQLSPGDLLIVVDPT